MIKKFDCVQKNIEHAQKNLNMVKIIFELADGIGIDFQIKFSKATFT